MTPRSLNRFLLFKLPAAFLCGVRVKELSKKSCEVGVTYRWINTNPFRSMYFAVQSMAAEMSTGALVLHKVKDSGHPMSTLVTGHTGYFTKKAVGKVRFICEDGLLCDDIIAKAINTGEGEKITLSTRGVDEQGDEVSNYQFEWSIKLRIKK